MIRERRALLLMVGTLFGAMALITLVLWLLLGRGSDGPDGPGAAAVASVSTSVSGSGRSSAATPTDPAPTDPSSVDPSSPADDASCTAAYTVTGSWPDGFGAQVVLTVAAGAAAGWQLTWTLPADAHVTELWNATLVSDGADGQPVRVTAPSWDPDLAAGETITIGFNGARGDDVPLATDLALDGVVCAAG